MNIAWKIVVFTLCINVASGMIYNFIGMENNLYNKNLTQEMLAQDLYGVSSGDGTSLDTTPVTGEVNWADNLLGLLGLGFIVDLIEMLNEYLYGLVYIILAILPVEAQDLESYMRWCITLCYTFSLFSLFTGKNLNED